MKITFNYHTHTYLCSHANGTPEEYVKKAIEGGIKYMGFSDHFPFTFPDGHVSTYRVPVEKVKTYFDEINELKKKYREKIDIKIGFEMEYYTEYFDEMLKNAIFYGADYLILGQHFIGPENLFNTIYSSRENNSNEDVKKYAELIINAIKTGVFSYIAHPDVFNFIGDEKVYAEEMAKICHTSKKYNIPLEINCLGIRDGRHYPNEKFWQIVGETGAPVTIGFDAHEASSGYDEKSLLKAEELIKKYKLNYIGKPNLIMLSKKRTKNI